MCGTSPLPKHVAFFHRCTGTFHLTAKMHFFFLQDPVLWYNLAISSANYVAVVASPPCSDEHDAVYKDLHVVGLNFMKELLRSETFEAKMFTIMLPYCNETGIPILARHLQRILLMQDIDKLVSLIHGSTPGHCGLYFCIRPALLSMIHNNLKTQGKNLNSYIVEMQNIVAQGVESGSVLKDSVDKDLKLLEEIEEKSLSLGKLVYEVPEGEELLNESNAAKSNYMNCNEFNLSDLDLTGMQNSVPLVPRKSQNSAQNSTLCCDDLQL